MLQQVTASLSAAVAANMSTMMETVANNIFTAISVDGDALAKAFFHELYPGRAPGSDDLSAFGGAVLL